MPASDPPAVTAVIPSYNGKHLLQKSLAGIVKVLGDSSVIVVEDAGADYTVEWLRREFAEVRSIVRSVNGGFSAAANDGIRAADSEFVLMLNNDVEITARFLEQILPLFEDERVFAVSPRILLPARGNLDEGCKTGYWHNGMFFVDQRRDVKSVTPILYCTACAAVYRRSMLQELGGFDEAYSPFYWEDVDLGFRAWKRGWMSLYQPASVVYHQHAASTSKIRNSFSLRIKARNSLFFIWRNIEDPALLSAHRRWLPLVLTRRAIVGDWPFVRGWQQAYACRNEAVRARARDSVYRKLSDSEIFTETGIMI